MEIAMQDKNNSRVSLYSQDWGLSLTHYEFDATSQIDDLTSEAAQGQPLQSHTVPAAATEDKKTRHRESLSLLNTEPIYILKRCI